MRVLERASIAAHIITACTPMIRIMLDLGGGG
jgi:hypothetical protein